MDSINLNEKNEFDYAVFKSNNFIQADQFDFSGLESATDYLFFSLIKNFNEHHKKTSISVDNIELKGCKNLTIWSLFYLNKTFNKTFNDFKSRVTCVQLIKINLNFLKTYKCILVSYKNSWLRSD